MNEENEAFIGDLRVQVLEGGRAALLSYVAQLKSGTIVHSESTLLATGPNGKLCLWPVMSEVPVVIPHAEVASETNASGNVKAVFGSGPRGETASFREEITIQISADQSLVYAHAWGLPGGTFEDRSSCRMVPRAA
ncbi:MAG: hypothetical protein H7Y19_17040 [Luteimonas sp.]|nr:hypothetical protein [Luteimonas sp.]